MTSFPGVVTRVAEAVKRQAVHLRYYQSDIKQGVHMEWARGMANVLAVAPTGGGKTILFCSMLAEHHGAAVAIAHRKELVTQISLTLNMFGVRHRLICPDEVRKLIVAAHIREHKVSYYDPNGMIGVGGVDTVINLENKPEHTTWRNSVTFWVQDEAHHVLKKNKWGKAIVLFPNTEKGLGVTATPERPDGQGLGAHVDGVFHSMVVGPGMRDLIDDGYLCDYKVWTIPHSVNYDAIKVGPSGEFVGAALVAAEECDKKLVGRIVETYQQRTPGLRAVCFMSSVKKAEETAEEFRRAGIPSVAVDGNTKDDVRAKAMTDLATGTIKVLVNCDLVGEGTDIPAVDVVIMGTRTASFIRFAQWWGRGARLMLSAILRQNYDDLDSAGRLARIAASEKPRYYVIDHGGNCIQHDGPPDLRQEPWTLDRKDRRSTGKSDAIPVRVCTNKGYTLHGITWEDARASGMSDTDLEEVGLATLEPGSLVCHNPYRAIMRECPECGYIPMPARRSSPQEVDGDLQELDVEALRELNRKVAEARLSPGELGDRLREKHLSEMKVKGHENRQREKLAAHNELDRAIGLFGGPFHVKGETDSMIQRRFFFAFGIDVKSAMALDRDGALKLAERIDNKVKGA